MVGLCLLAGVLLAGMLFPVAGGLGLAASQATDTLDSVSGDMRFADVPLTTTITDRDGKPIAWVYNQHRTITPANEIAPAMKTAIIAIEDRRFLEHDGVDWRGTTRALVTNQLHNEVVQGGSTLTMQYVKNYLLYVVAKTDADRARVTEQTPARKLREIQAALQLERQLSKEQILADYLNIVNFGNQAYGVAAAAKTYFDTTPNELTVAQAALLAGMVKSTSQYDPVRHPEEALKRRNLVIDAMAEIGTIQPHEADAAKQEDLGVVDPLNHTPNGCVGAGPNFGFYCAYALKYLEQIGFTEEQLRNGGYVVKTSLDRDATIAAKQAAEAQVPKRTNGIANVMAVVQPGKERHAVVALAANRDFGLNKDKGETSYRLPSDTSKFGAGSIYKIFTAAAAMEKGMGINWDVSIPRTYSAPNCPRDGGQIYTVSNAGDYPGRATLQGALASSPNTTFVQMIEDVGVDKAVDMAYALGMRDAMEGINSAGEPKKPDEKSRGQAAKDQNQCSFTLGPGPTGALELANVGATLMSSGMWCPPSPIEEILDRNGKPVEFTEQKCDQAVPAGLADTLAVGLSQDHTAGTARAAATAAGWTRPMIGKTGTTQLHQSAGFVAATPQYAGAVLTFADGTAPQGICDQDPNPPVLCGQSGTIYGGRVPARTWFTAMTKIHQGLEVQQLRPADPKYANGSRDTNVPDVVGRPAGEAASILEGAGYRVSQVWADHGDARRGIVFNQSPRSRAFRGSLVTIYISKGGRKKDDDDVTPTWPVPRPGDPTNSPGPPGNTTDPPGIWPPPTVGPGPGG